MKKLKGMLPYLIVMVLNFYLLPFLIRDTGSGMVMLLGVIPLICFVCSILYGIKYSFHWYYALIVAVIFAPTILIFYNSTAWVYIVGYGVVALLGNAVGTMFTKRRT